MRCTTHGGTVTTALLRKRAELAGSLGAGILGLGLGLLLRAARSAALVTLFAGASLHAWGMWSVHRIDQGAPTARWMSALYWTCWALLAVLGVYLALGPR